MITGTVQSISPTKNKDKFWVNLQGDNRSYITSNQMIQMVQPGTTITFSTKEPFGKPGDLKYPFDEFNATQEQSFEQFVGESVPVQESIQKGLNGTKPDEATMRFISNVVAHAIQAGALKTPAEIASWVNAAKQAL